MHQPVEGLHATNTPSFPIEKLPGSLPRTNIGAGVDHAAIAAACLEHLENFNPEAFTDDAIWRDLYALTGTLRTFNGAEHIKSAWTEMFGVHHQSRFTLVPGSSKIIPLDVNCSWIQARFQFETRGQPETLCSGMVSVVSTSQGGWKIWVLITILEEIRGFPNPDYLEPQTVDEDISETNGNKLTHFDCVIVGAGPAGLCLSGRLKTVDYQALL